MVVLSINFSYAQAPKRIALLPFKINSAQDLSFLKDGIFDMLTSVVGLLLLAPYIKFWKLASEFTKLMSL